MHFRFLSLINFRLSITSKCSEPLEYSEFLEDNPELSQDINLISKDNLKEFAISINNCFKSSEIKENITGLNITKIKRLIVYCEIYKQYGKDKIISIAENNTTDEIIAFVSLLADKNQDIIYSIIDNCHVRFSKVKQLTEIKKLYNNNSNVMGDFQKKDKKNNSEENFSFSDYKYSLLLVLILIILVSSFRDSKKYRTNKIITVAELAN